MGSGGDQCGDNDYVSLSVVLTFLRRQIYYFCFKLAKIE